MIIDAGNILSIFEPIPGKVIPRRIPRPDECELLASRPALDLLFPAIASSIREKSSTWSNFVTS
jgi:hypothetical protein